MPEPKKNAVSVTEWIIIVAVIAVLAVSLLPLYSSRQEVYREYADAANETAAAAVATSLMYTSDVGIGFIRYYDAENGALLEQAPETAYGLGRSMGDVEADNRGKFIRVAMASGVPSVTWVDAVDEPPA